MNRKEVVQITLQTDQNGHYITRLYSRKLLRLSPTR